LTRHVPRQLCVDVRNQEEPVHSWMGYSVDSDIGRHCYVGLKTRTVAPESIDRLDLPPPLHDAELLGLEQINFWSHSAGILWPSVRRLARQVAPRPVRVLDLATGGGDVAVSLWKKARRRGVALQIDGCDFHPRSIEYARRRAQAQGADVRFFRLDAVQEPLPPGYDLLMCSLFLHHLTDEVACRFIARMAEATRHMICINDLLRCRRGLILAYCGASVLTRSREVRADAPQSVRAGFALDEMAALARTASLRDFRLGRRWPCRFLFEWSRA